MQADAGLLGTVTASRDQGPLGLMNKGAQPVLNATGLHTSEVVKW